MPRQKLSEYRAKVLVSEDLNLPYVGWSISEGKQLTQVRGSKTYVLKVDQAEKQRFKKGLVALDAKKNDLKVVLDKLKEKGYEHFIVEPYFEHSEDAERYISLGYDRNGHYLTYSAKGGINVEGHAELLSTVRLDDATNWSVLAEETGFQEDQLKRLLDTFKQQYFTFLEINPYVITDSGVHILDAAIEADDAGMFFAQGWTSEDLRSPLAKKRTLSEEFVGKLNEKSPASFNLNVLNPNGAVFLLLSGGGASVVIADEVYNRGLGDLLANYGEYSGNPNARETYLYTSEVLKLIKQSKAKKKVVFIGGAVANFTDIANTFSGVIQAIDDHAADLIKAKVKVYVRRGGPRQEIGLAKMKTALEAHGILGGVYDPSHSISTVLESALDEVR